MEMDPAQVGSHPPVNMPEPETQINAMVAQVENAISIAYDYRSDQNLRSQALLFVNQLRNDSAAWQVCLPLFTRSPPPDEPIRVFCLEVVNNAITSPNVDVSSRNYIKTSLMEYVRSIYHGRGRQDFPVIQNKLAQTLTELFIALYPDVWPSFFDDFLSLAGGPSIGFSNVPGTILYLRLLGSIHDEIADQLILRTPEQAKKHTELRDAIRARDVQKVSMSWQEILGKWRQLDLNVVEMCLKTLSRWVSWIDISLVANQQKLNPLLEMAGQQASNGSVELRVRDAAIEAFTEIASKKMRPPEKVELINFLNLGSVVGQLIASPPLEQCRNTPTYDADLAELVAKLVNNIVRDLVVILDSSSNDVQTKQLADDILPTFVPYLLRFFSDEYDEVCWTVLDSVSDLLTYFRKVSKARGSLPSRYSGLLPRTLEAIIAKMKYDETASWGWEDGGDESDEAEFQELRKKLNTLQQIIMAIDEKLYMDTLGAVVEGIFDKLRGGQTQVDWRELDLALHEVYLFGDLATKNRGIYQKRQPSSLAAEKLIKMVVEMLQAHVGEYPHPAVQLQYLELCVRYVQIFEENATLIPQALEDFVRLAHSDNNKVRYRGWYLFSRFVRGVKGRIGEVSQTIIQAIGDLLVIKAEIRDPSENGEDEENDTGSDSEIQSDTVFNSQLHLFDAVGCMASSHSVPLQNKVLYVQSVINPLFADLERTLPSAKGNDERSLLQVHHDIMALGTLARGFTDWMPGSKQGERPADEVQAEFRRAAEAVLASLEALNSSVVIRTAARFSFSRLIGGMGAATLQQLPRWIDGLLTQTSSKEEMNFFLRLLEQVIFGFRGETLPILDVVLTPLLQRVFERLAETPSGTDDELQLEDLRKEFLSFILCILNNDLAAAFVSTTNQAIFDTLINCISIFARTPSDLSTSCLSFSVLTKMVSIWGGQDIAPNDSSQQPQPALPGFDQFAVTRFAPLSWDIPSSPGFRVRDPSARKLVYEIASLQQEILKKTGGLYENALREELRGMGAQESDIQGYVEKLKGDSKQFKEFLVAFLGRGS